MSWKSEYLGLRNSPTLFWRDWKLRSESYYTALILQCSMLELMARVGCFKRTASKHVYYLGWNRSPAQVGCMRQALRPGALGRPRGSGWRGRWEGGSGWGTHVNPWLFHFNVWQNSLQIKKNKLKKKRKLWIIFIPWYKHTHSFRNFLIDKWRTIQQMTLI